MNTGNPLPGLVQHGRVGAQCDPASDVVSHVISRPLETPPSTWARSYGDAVTKARELDRRTHTDTVGATGQTVRFMPVSSLWTPSGEHKIDRPEPASGAAGDPSGPDGSDAPKRPGPASARGRSEVDGPDEAELDEVRQQLLDAPVEVVVANHAYGLFELAALHLSAQPPNLDKARLAVDALGALIEGLAGRLDNVEPALMEALAQIRLAYVQISASGDADARHDSDGQQSA